MRGHEVTHADGPYLAIREQLFERPVGVQREVEAARQRLMEKQQIDPLDPKLANAPVERVQRGFVPVVADPDLRFDEHLIARDPRPTDAFSNLALIEIRSGRVDQAISLTDRELDGGTGVLG